MSFGLLKHFKDLKKNPALEKSAPFCRHIILGQDLGAVLKLLEIKRNFPSESVKLISSRPLNRQMLVETYQYGVCTLRSEASVKEITKKYFDVKFIPQTEVAQFYKDGKFHEFSGRAKPMELLSGESFFVPKGYRLDLSSLFQTTEWENLDAILSECQEIRLLESIEKTTPVDLVEKSEWTLIFKDFQKLSSEYLHVSLSPKKFLSHLVHKEQMTPELIKLCTSTHIQAALSLTWNLDKEVYGQERTLFIPQSMTHEWGHFIVEFEAFDELTKNQRCHAIFLIHEDEPQTEDLASKIKLMKRVLDRTFPEFERHIQQEFIRFDEEMFISEIQDEMLEQVSFDYPQLKFLSQMAPVPTDLSEEKFLARVLLS